MNLLSITTIYDIIPQNNLAVILRIQDLELPNDMAVLSPPYRYYWNYEA